MPRFTPLIVIAASAAAGCFPDFQFGSGSEGGSDVSSSRAASGTGVQMTTVGGAGGAPTNGVGGTPGQGGIPSHGGEAAGGEGGSGGSTSTGVVEMPSVPCGDGNSVLVESLAVSRNQFESQFAFLCGKREQFNASRLRNTNSS